MPATCQQQSRIDGTGHARCLGLLRATRRRTQQLERSQRSSGVEFTAEPPQQSGHRRCCFIRHTLQDHPQQSSGQCVRTGCCHIFHRGSTVARCHPAAAPPAAAASAGSGAAAAPPECQRVAREFSAKCHCRNGTGQLPRQPLLAAVAQRVQFENGRRSGSHRSDGRQRIAAARRHSSAAVQFVARTRVQRIAG